MREEDKNELNGSLSYKTIWHENRNMRFFFNYALLLDAKLSIHLSIFKTVRWDGFRFPREIPMKKHFLFARNCSKKNPIRIPSCGN